MNVSLCFLKKIFYYTYTHTHVPVKIYSFSFRVLKCSLKCCHRARYYSAAFSLHSGHGEPSVLLCGAGSFILFRPMNTTEVIFFPSLSLSQQHSSRSLHTPPAKQVRDVSPACVLSFRTAGEPGGHISHFTRSPDQHCLEAINVDGNK